MACISHGIAARPCSAGPQRVPSAAAAAAVPRCQQSQRHLQARPANAGIAYLRHNHISATSIDAIDRKLNQDAASTADKVQ
jgi:hypothetical protein